MKKSIILENARKKLDVTALNPMQEAMSATEAKEIILLSPTGSGKTLAFCLRMLRYLREPGAGFVQAVILAPSRELVIQIAGVTRSLATGYKTVALYGGHSMQDETRSLQPVPDIIVATPGRMLDHLNRNNISVDRTEALVLDEYDKSLELGFAMEMKHIIKRMNRRRLTILTSATAIADMPDYMKLSRPETFDYTSSDKAQEPLIEVARVESPERDKLGTLESLLKSLPNGRAIVFVNHRESAERVHTALRQAQLPAGLYHGGLEQVDREKAIDLFNNGTTPILVSTDLGSRGLDIDDVNYIIHYHMPTSPESWTHRNGRTARMGASGSVYLITGPDEPVPDNIEFNDTYTPSSVSPDPITSNVATLYFNLGRREKISRGDVAGFLIQKGGLEAQEVGKIIVRDHAALASVPKDKAQSVIDTVKSDKIKGQRVRVSLMQ